MLHTLCVYLSSQLRCINIYLLLFATLMLIMSFSGQRDMICFRQNIALEDLICIDTAIRRDSFKLFI